MRRSRARDLRDFKVHWTETGTKAACGQDFGGKQTNRLDLVTCGRCLAIAKRRREKPVRQRLHAPEDSQGWEKVQESLQHFMTRHSTTGELDARHVEGKDVHHPKQEV